VPWLLRVAWIGVVFAAVPAIDAALADEPDALADTALAVGGVLWIVGVAAMAIPAVVSLTATRAIVPLAVPVALLAAIAGADAAPAVGFVLAACIAALLACSAELGRAFVQASAYGDEDRHVLRPPLAYLVASLLTWVVWAAALIAGSLLLADRRWIVGGLCVALALAGAVWAWPRWHKLSRRWIVFVPTGVVVHDHVVLAETLMLRRQEVAGLRLAPADTEALDLTGPASGHAVELSTPSAATAIMAATPSEPRGRVVHFTACLVSPTRPGRVLTAAQTRRLPVGGQPAIPPPSTRRSSRS
jgi:hypothetical protein